MLILLLFFFQTSKPQAMDAASPNLTNPDEAVDLRIYLSEGERVDMVQARLRGMEPLSFEFKSQKERTSISLLNILRIEKVPDSMGQFKLWFDTGETEVGKIENLEFVADKMTGVLNPHPVRLYEVERIQIFAGSRLRYCVEGHYEAVTAYPLCPICGKTLELGSEDDEPDDQEEMHDRTHILRLDGR